jgi:hypothetical protein
MCRSIKTLRGLEPTASEEEIRAAALPYVRKISGYRQPSRANQPVFDAAVDEIAAASQRLLEGLGTKSWVYSTPGVANLSSNSVDRRLTD